MSFPRGIKDRTGHRSGLLVAVSYAGQSSDHHAAWLCRCDCGGTVTVSGNNLNKTTFSCGCQKRKGLSLRHGHSANGKLSPTYGSWRSMVQRCTNPNSNRWFLYGAMGVKICDRWMVFDNFLADMGERPRGMTLDRYPNNEGDYKPGNVRWATASQQFKNRRKKK